MTRGVFWGLCGVISAIFGGALGQWFFLTDLHFDFQLLLTAFLALTTSDRRLLRREMSIGVANRGGIQVLSILAMAVVIDLIETRTFGNTAVRLLCVYGLARALVRCFRVHSEVSRALIVAASTLLSIAASLIWSSSSHVMDVFSLATSTIYQCALNGFLSIPLLMLFYSLDDRLFVRRRGHRLLVTTPA